MHFFFVGPRAQFFRPLTHNTRELCAAVLRALHDRVYGPNADYAEVLTRDLVLSIAQQEMGNPALRAQVFPPDQPIRAEDERAEANDVLNKLKEHGWLEDYRDPIDLRPTLRLSRSGKAFSESFAALDDSRTKTRQRNMRSARKALAAFLGMHDADELLDAYEFATRVVQDLQDDIEYFRQLIQSLTRDALDQHVAWDEFNAFIEKKFAREYAVRLVADSAERHRGQINHALEQVRALDNETRATVDAHLAQRAPWLDGLTQGRSAMLWLADRIESVVEAACGLKLPMLRAEMHNYVRRFTSLLRQALSLDYGAHSPLGRVMATIRDHTPGAGQAILDHLCQRFAPAEVRLAGSLLRWAPADRTAPALALPPLEIDDASRLEAALRRAEAEAFAFSDEAVLTSLIDRLTDGPITLAHLPVTTAKEAVYLLHAVGAARSSEGRDLVLAKKIDSQVRTPFFSADDYAFELITPPPTVQPAR